MWGISPTLDGRKEKENRDTGENPCFANVFDHRVTSLTRSPHSLVHGEGLKILDNHEWYVLSKVVL